MKIEKEGIHIYLKDEYVENAYFITTEYPLMKNNSIPSFLPLEFREQDGKSSVYYEITGKESLVQIGQKRLFGYEEIRGLLEGFLNLFHGLEDYMLSLKQVSFAKENIFMDYQKKIYWIYGPKIYEDVQGDIEEIFLWLLSFVNPEDSLALGLAHRVYSASKQGGITREYMEQCLNEGKKEKGRSEGQQKSIETGDNLKNNQYEINDEAKIMEDEDSKISHSDIHSGLDIHSELDAYSDSSDSHSKTHSDTQGKKMKKEQDSKERNSKWILGLKMILLLLNLILMGYWIYFINRYGMHRLILGLSILTLCLLILVSTSLFREILRKRMKKEDSLVMASSSEESQVSNLSAKSIFEELDQYWEKGQNIIIESEDMYHTLPYLYHIASGKMEAMKVFPYYIGSEEGLNQLIISHKTVSRQHAVIMKKQDNQLYLEDLESVHGTWVNGSRILPGDSILIHQGDEIAFGREKFQYCLE